MVDGESLPPSKKRVAGREISRDDPGLDADEDAPEEEMGTFKRASDEVLASRRIVKVRRNVPASSAASNPFAAVRLVPQPTDSSPTSGDVSNPKQSDTFSATQVSRVHEFSESGDTNEPEKAHQDMLPTELTDESASKSVVIEENSEGTLGDPSKKPNGTTNTERSHTEPDDLPKEANEKPTGDLPKEAIEIPKGAAGDVTELKVSHELKGDSGDVPPMTINEGNGGSDKDVTELHSSPKPEIVISEEQAATQEGDANGDGATKGTSTTLNMFQQLSGSQNAFTGLVGTGFSNPSFSFGTLPTKDSVFSFGGAAGSGSGSSSIFGLKGNSTSLFGASNPNTGSSLQGFGLPAAAMQEVPVETGEENEKAIFVADAALFEFLDGGWKERGKGELKLNVTTANPGKARLVMRAKGNYRLILNASLYANMKLTNMEKKGITFACVNSASEGKSNTLDTFALKFKENSIVERFRAAVMDHRGNKPAVLNTPENSPKASED